MTGLAARAFRRLGTQCEASARAETAVSFRGFEMQYGQEWRKSDSSRSADDETKFHAGTMFRRDEARGVWNMVDPSIQVPAAPIALNKTTMLHHGVVMIRNEERGVWNEL